MKDLILKTFNRKIKNITKYYKKLISYNEKNKSLENMNELIINNYYLIIEQQVVIGTEFFRKELLKISSKKGKKIYYLIYEIMKKENFQISSKALFKCINELQDSKENYFSYDEIDYIFFVIRMVIINELSDLCYKLHKQLIHKENLDKLFDKIRKKLDNNKNVNIEKYIKIDESILDDYTYVEELSYKLNELGQISEPIVKNIKMLLADNNISYNKLLKSRYSRMTDENILMINLISLLKKITRVKIEHLYNDISYTEKALKSEKANYYDNMYESSKVEYRNKIKSIVKKKKLNEYEFVKELLEKANKENKHIGFYLFKDYNYKLRTYFYVIAIEVITVILSFIVSLKLGWPAFFLILIPVSSFVIDVINKILQESYDTIAPFRLKLENGLDKENSTMVVIPTILKNGDKTREMFEKLESYYLSNKTDNLYFTILGDASSEKTKEVPCDEEIVKAGIGKVNELNNKYKKNIFHFVYRNRFYSEGEGCFLGYERKRGALIHFSALLLGKLSEEEKKSYFRCHTFDNFDVKIKYVITMDADTKLLLNTALKLIGTMMHPMNKPVLSEDKKKVIKGYAIMQPKMSLDIEVTSKSIYAQLFGGLGGLDVYSTKSFDIYQDIFNEGSFVGKGIYDLDVFYTVLSNAFPENLILSHDLIEGNYLRCRFISDVELFDSFPSKYLNDAIRHHRWCRGDVQIAGWLRKKVRTSGERIKNPFNLLEQWKIFDNIRRSLIIPFLLLIILYGFTFGIGNPAIYLLFVLILIAMPIIFYLLYSISFRHKQKLFLKYYLFLIRGLLAVINKACLVFLVLPYEAYLYLDAIIKSWYRINISKKNLLNWIPFEEVELISKNTLPTYLKGFKVNYIVSLILIVLCYIFKPDYIYIALFVTFFWVIAPFVMYFISQDMKDKSIFISDKMNDDIRDIAVRTWKYFERFLTKEYNYLIPDNYQVINEKIDYRTSPTNIGFSLVSIVSAYELNIINLDTAINLIENVIKNVKDLKKWNGHLYNWYDIYNKREIYPFTVSTADSGNFVASLCVVKGFLEKHKYYELSDTVSKLIDSTDFSKLYNTEEDVFSIGYNVCEDKMIAFNYNTFSSENRIASFIAIAKGDVPFKHWFCLDKTLTKHKRYKGIISWTGTMFEYYMPLIFMKTFKHTILDETYSFVHYVQKEFIKEIDSSLPWGITESAYAETDDLGNYKYKAFGIPYLKTHDVENPLIVVAPYAPIMAITKYTQDVYNNINKFKKLGVYGKYGFYESYDNEEKKVVQSYYPHHQGMIISSIANYFKDNVIQEYFHFDKRIEAVEILLKEKVQIKPYIDLRIEKYKKYRHERIEQDNIVKVQDDIEKIPSVGVLSNGKYTVFLNDRGLGFSKYKNIQINRYRVVTDNNYGIFVYLKDLTNNKIWSNTYLPCNKKPDEYRVIYTSGSIKYIREDDNIITSTEVAVTKDHNAEIRKITIENNSDKDIELQVTSYSEVILGLNDADLSNRVFNDITLSSEVDLNSSSLIFVRSSRKKTYPEYFVASRMFMDNDENVDFEFETSRLNFIGRNNTLQNPIQICSDEKLSCNTNDSLDPIMSIRKNIKLKVNQRKTIYLIVCFAETRKNLMDTINVYNDSKTIDIAFRTSALLSDIRNNYLSLTKDQFYLYNSLLKYIYQPYSTHENREMKGSISNIKIYKTGLSIYFPLILVDMEKSLDLSFIKELFKLQEFYKSISISVNIAILYSGDANKKKEVEDYVIEMTKAYSFENTPGNILLFYRLSNQYKDLLRTFAKVYFDITDFKSLNQEIVELNNSKVETLKINYNKALKVIKPKLDETKDFFNEYGGFINKGKEYVTTPDTPMPWVNVISNPTFGFVVTNNLGGFTYAYNSREFKLTSWSNDVVQDSSSETIYINNQKLVPSKVTHGFGYTIFNTNTEEYDIETKVFASEKDNIKIYELDIVNKKGNSIDLDFVIKPVLGAFEEQTNTYIITDFDKEKNSLILQNIFNKPFKNNKLFITSTEPIIKYDDNNILDRSISININGSKKIAFMIGCSSEISSLIKKYKNTRVIENEYKKVVDSWNKRLSFVEVKTPDKSFDYMINGWYLYQVYSSRLYSRTGFYQVGGAYGFRDQLQDVMCLLHSNPKYAKERILDHAAHQFIKGDALHWWHEELKLGARTRFSDDYLWLIYVTYEYIKVTGDKSILNENVHYVEGDQLGEKEKEKGIFYSYSKKKESLYEHLKKAMTRALTKFGDHGLPLIGIGDWNDGLNKVGDKGKGESVWLAFFLYDLLNKMSEISSIKNDKNFASHCDKEAIKLKRNINKNAWDGKWYLRAYFDDGKPLGSSKNKECKIDLIPQAWSILTDIIEEDRIKPLINEVDERLVDNENKIIKLLTPPFDNLENNPGYISDYIPGVRENGAQYTHAALWYIKALLKINDIDKAYKYFSMINPINRTLNKYSADIYKVEPYVIAADIYSNKNFAGRGGWTWYTGSASWAYKIALEDILGLKKIGNELQLDPRIPSTWDNFEITYKYESTTYKIYVNNPEHVSTGIKEVIHNDKVLDNNIIKLIDDNKKHIVIVNMGGSNDKI